jgi:glutamyl-tRNA synthetase
VSESAGPLDALLRERRLDPADPRVELAVELFRDTTGTPERLADEIAGLLRWEPRSHAPATRRLGQAGARRALVASRATIGDTPELDADGAADALERTSRASGLGRRIVEHVVRLALTGRSQGPDLARLVAALGRDEVARRLDHALASRVIATRKLA